MSADFEPGVTPVDAKQLQQLMAAPTMGVKLKIKRDKKSKIYAHEGQFEKAVAKRRAKRRMGEISRRINRI